MTTFSVIVPTLDEESYLPACLAGVRRSLPSAEVIVVDGGSRDATVQLAEARGARVLRSPPSRGGQCRLGAAHARGEVLCFLHADTELVGDAEAGLRAFFADPGNALGTLRLAYPPTRPMYRLLSLGSRLDGYLSSMGDQGIIVRRTLYDDGGMPELPLFEDVEFFIRARKKTRVRSIPVELRASTRRFEARGLYRQLALNLSLCGLYAAGVSAERLARWYRGSAASAR